MSSFQFPIHLQFRITTLANDFTASDANGNVIAYVRQKMFKFKEDIQIFSDTSKEQMIYTIKADRWLDFSASYLFARHSGEQLGRIARKGWRSIWKASYEIIDADDNFQFHISERNAWVKVMDNLFSEIPILGIFTGYLFNPIYDVKTPEDELVFELKKQPSFWGRKFEIHKHSDNVSTADGERILLGLMMMVLLERRRG